MKWLWLCLQPSNLLFLLVATGVLLLFLNARKSGAILAGVGLAGVLAISIFPLAALLLTPLEERFPQPDLPSHVDGIVVLGGAFNPILSKHRGQPALSSRAERMTETVRLARLYPEARIVFSGGAWRGDPPTEAEVARTFFTGLGLAEDRLVLEDRSTSTAENARFTTELVNPGAEETWLLVTTASHMPRAVGAFRKQGWSPIPYPVDYTTGGDIDLFGFPLIGRNLAEMDAAVRAWVALGYYRLAGYTDTLLPGAEATRSPGSESE